MMPRRSARIQAQSQQKLNAQKDDSDGKHAEKSQDIVAVNVTDEEADVSKLMENLSLSPISASDKSDHDSCDVSDVSFEGGSGGRSPFAKSPGLNKTVRFWQFDENDIDDPSD